MDREDIEVEFEPEQESSSETLEKIIGRTILSVELLEEDTQAMIKICFTKDKEDFLLIHAEGANLYLIEPKPTHLH